MKRLLTICAVLMMLAVSAGAQTATVDVSLEPSTNMVQVGDTFELKLWLKSSDGSTMVMDDAHLLLEWDPACVSFSGSLSTVNGDYDWTKAMSFMGMDLPMYPFEGSGGWNETYDDGDAKINLYPGFAAFQGMSHPQTDLKAVTLTFTALASTGSTLIDIRPMTWAECGVTSGIIEEPTGIPIGGIGTGATVSIAKLVDIDIKPGSCPNSINPNAGGVIPVAILTTADFDASTVDPQTVALEGTAARGKGKSGNYGSMEDVDADGDLDLVVQIQNVINWDLEATEATLTGETFDGIPIQGTDTVNIVPPE